MTDLVRFFYTCLFFGFILNSHAQVPKGYKLCENRITNGDFSQIKENFITTYKFTNKRSYENGPMVDEGQYGITHNPRIIHHMFSPCRDHTDGNSNMMVVNGSPNTIQVVWGKRLNVKPNQKYLLSFWLASAHDASPAELKVMLFLDKINKSSIRASSSRCKWTKHSVVIETGDRKEIMVGIANVNTVNMGNDFLLDDIMLQKLVPVEQDCEGCCDKKEKTPIEEVKANKETVTIATTQQETVQADTTLESTQQIQCGKIFRLDNIQFHDNTSNFKGIVAAKQTMFVIFDYLKANPKATVELHGHSDIFGNQEQNKVLSRERVIKIQRWLSMKGIHRDRITYKAFGSTQPIDPEGNPANRRVEARFDCQD